jgi:hypothetical protein
MYSESESDTESDFSTLYYEQQDLINNNYYNYNSYSDSDNEIIIDDIDSDDDFDDDYNEIYQNDSEHMYSEKEQGRYYIGISKFVRTYNIILMVNSVSTNAFFRYPFDKIRSYLTKYSIMNMQNARVHIMKLHILIDGSYSVVLKTFWLRLIQRHWKKVFRERASIIKKRCSIKNLLLKEICGKYSNNLQYLPTINGLLECYNGVFYRCMQ